jgi:hypothetical protein
MSGPIIEPYEDDEYMGREWGSGPEAEQAYYDDFWNPTLPTHIQEPGEDSTDIVVYNPPGSLVPTPGNDMPLWNGDSWQRGRGPNAPVISANDAWGIFKHTVDFFGALRTDRYNQNGARIDENGYPLDESIWDSLNGRKGNYWQPPEGSPMDPRDPHITRIDNSPDLALDPTSGELIYKGNARYVASGYFEPNWDPIALDAGYWWSSGEGKGNGWTKGPLSLNDDAWSKSSHVDRSDGKYSIMLNNITTSVKIGNETFVYMVVFDFPVGGGPFAGQRTPGFLEIWNYANGGPTVRPRANGDLGGTATNPGNSAQSAVSKWMVGDPPLQLPPSVQENRIGQSESDPTITSVLAAKGGFAQISQRLFPQHLVNPFALTGALFPGRETVAWYPASDHAASMGRGSGRIAGAAVTNYGRDGQNPRIGREPSCDCGCGSAMMQGGDPKKSAIHASVYADESK